MMTEQQLTAQMDSDERIAAEIRQKGDPPELRTAIEMLRTIYWREYGRGWREAVGSVKRVLEQKAAEVSANGELSGKDKP